MTYRGQVKNRVIVLEEGTQLPEGTVVRVQPLKRASAGKQAAGGQPLGQRLMKFAGKAKGLPGDMVRNHDHDIHGAPRK